jgi:glycine dehydrogenase
VRRQRQRGHGDLKLACESSANLACIMITYPSTHGVFETQVKEL